MLYDQQEKNDYNSAVLAGEDGTVYAPEDGLLISVNCEEEEELTGESTLISYTTRDDTVSIDVSEEDIAAISVGSSAEQRDRFYIPELSANSDL